MATIHWIPTAHFGFKGCPSAGTVLIVCWFALLTPICGAFAAEKPLFLLVAGRYESTTYLWLFAKSSHNLIQAG
jgi:hypothetical protein